MKPTPIFVATKKIVVSDSNHFKNSILVFDDRSQKYFNEYSQRFKEDTLLKVSVTRLIQKKIRSVEQNAYYWGVVIKMLAEALGYIGVNEKEDLHNELKSMFLVYIGRLGRPVVAQTSKLDTVTFERYLEAIRAWALSFCGVNIPKPNQVESEGDWLNLGEGS